MSGPLRVAVDIGGTFTDIVLQDGDRLLSSKLLSTVHAPEDAVLQGVSELLAEAGRGWPELDALILGTTLATNALIERKGARTALITTAGFRDLLEIGWEDRFAQYDVFLDKPAPLVPRELRFGLAERIDAQGQVVLALDEDGIAALADSLHAAAVESVAVCFLHAYANPAHEQRVRTRLQALLPGLTISLSSEVCPEIREYERLSTTCANAYVQPLIAGALQRLAERSAALGLRRPVLLITSAGSLCGLDSGVAEPVRLVESGPAGGAVLATELARRLQLPRVLAFDMGGTTAKICFIDDYRPQHSRRFEFGRMQRHLKGSGLPLRVPVVELVEIGAGGGSIARRNGLGLVQVGPDSAGAAPGPAAYGLGGEAATVTDAHLLLGRLDPQRFAAQRVRLLPERAEAAFRQALPELSPQIGAQAVLEVVDESMANAARIHASELGKGLEGRSLIAFGGAAPLHAVQIARKLGLRRVIVPALAGVGSALGFLQAPAAYQAVRSLYQGLDQGWQPAAVQALFEQLRAGALAVVRSAAPQAELHERRSAQLRYAGQGHELEIELPEGPLGAETADALRRAFQARYQALFGHALAHVPIEAISWTLQLAERRTQPPPAAPTPAPQPELAAQRTVWDAARLAWAEWLVQERAALQPGQPLAGPALLVEDQTTTVLPPGWRAVLLGGGDLLLQPQDEQQGAPHG